MKKQLPDVQVTSPEIKEPIMQVGIENIKLPLVIETRSGSFSSIIANISLRTSLDKNYKGISMSRLPLSLQEYVNGKVLKQKLIQEFLFELSKKINAINAFARFTFDLPLTRKSPLSKYEFPIYQKSFFEGHLVANQFKFYEGFVFQYASYCPCSAALCQDLRDKNSNGFPHAQRSYANVVVKTTSSDVWLEDVIDLIQKDIKTIPYPIIKRVDEQEIARIAAKNPMFVEDAIRIISKNLNSDKRILDWWVKCQHEESIHMHEAIAINFKGIENGFGNDTNINI